MKKKTAESGIFGSVHEAAVGLFHAGVVDAATMREFDILCFARTSADDDQKN